MGERERIKLSGVEQRQWMLMPEREVTRESTPPKPAQPPMHREWGHPHARVGGTSLCGISTNKVFHQCQGGHS